MIARLLRLLGLLAALVATADLANRLCTWVTSLPMETISGRGTCPAYLYRWELWRHGDYAAYIHHFVGDDWSQDHHDHPKRFISLGFRGSYLEHTPAGTKQYRAPWLRTFPAEHRHRITVEPGQEAWTLVVVLKATRPWGFWLYGKTFVPWRDYIPAWGQERKACP